MDLRAAAAAAPLDEPPREALKVYLVLLFSFSLAVRLLLIERYPVVFGGDAILRLANHDRIQLSHQLPLLQSIVYATSLISTDPALMRSVMALIGAGATVAVFAMMRPLIGATAALGAAFIFAVHPFILPLSTVPYQEILMVGCLALAFASSFQERWWLASLSMAAACMTRYEAWFAAPGLAAWYVLRGGMSPRRVLEGALLFGWAPLSWILRHGGLTPVGSYAVEARLNPERLVRWVYLGWLTLKFTPWPALPLAGLGAWVLVRHAFWRERSYQVLAAFLAIFLVGVLVSAHGVGDQPERFVTSREAHIPLVGMIVLIGLGLSSIRRGRSLWVAASVLVGLWMADRYVDRDTSEPALALSREVALFLDDQVEPGQEVVVLARPIPGVEDYLEKAEQRSGIRGRAQALEILRTTETTPPGYQMILVHARMEKDQLRSLATLWAAPETGSALRIPVVDPPSDPGSPAWVVLWSDFAPTNDAERQLAQLVSVQQPIRTFQRASLGVRVFRLSAPGPVASGTPTRVPP